MLKRPLNQVLASCITALVIGAPLIILNPYRLADELDSGGRDLFMRIVAPSQSAPAPPISVVLLTDRSLGDLGASWPAPFEVHAAAIERICASGANAVLADFVFIDQRADPTLASLVETLQQAPPSCQIFLAADTRGRILNDLRAVADERDNVQLVSVARPEEGGAPGLYDLGAVAGLPAAASAIAGEQLGSGPRTIDIWWRAPPVQWACTNRQPDPRCSQIATQPLARALRLAIFQFSPASFSRVGDRELFEIDATPYPSVDLSDLLGAQAADLDNRLVFYGGDFAYSADRVHAPPYRDLPGVFAHAAATDNLLTLGDGVIAAAPPFQLTPRTHRLMQLFILCAGGLGVGFLWEAGRGLYRRARRPPPKSAMLRSGVHLVNRYAFEIGLVATFVILGLLEFFIMRVSPIYWTSALAAAALGQFDFGLRTWLVRPAPPSKG